MSDIEKLKREIIEIIETRYNQRKNNCGWGLLYSKLYTLGKSQNDIIFLGINPGGDPEAESKSFAYEGEHKTWYKDEWENDTGEYGAGQAPLQKQVIYLLETLLNCQTENVLSGNVVPFISKDETSINHEDWECGGEIWRKILNAYIKQHGKVNIITMGVDVEDSICNIFENTESNLSKLNTLPTAWGDMTARFYKNSTGTVKMCYLPHLSRFGIFNRKLADSKKQQQYKQLEKYIQDFFN